MAKKGGSKHLKRLPAPANWPIHRKEFKWVAKPKPGPHSVERSLPLLLIVREILGFVKTRNEAKIMLSAGQIKVDGRVIREDDYPVGMMDLIEISSIKKSYRILPSHKGLKLHTLQGNEKDFKLCKIVSKTTAKGGHLQLNLHDGKNVLVKIAGL